MKIRVVRLAFMSLLVLLVGATALVLSLDFGRFKGEAEVFVGNLLQREFSIDGPLHLRIGRTIDLSAADVRLASTDWAETPALVSIRSIEASVNTWSLFRGRTRLESLTLDGVRINLEESESGDNNWTFVIDPDETPVSGEAPPKEDLAEPPSLPVLPQNINITDLVLVYDNPDMARSQRVVINQLQQTILESQEMEFKLGGNINEIPVELNLVAGNVIDLIEYSDVEFVLDARVGDISIEAVAEIADLLNPSQPTVALRLSGAKIEHVTEVLGIQQITTGPLQLEIKVEPDGDRMLLDLAGTLGEFTVLANGKFSDLQKLDEIELEVSASGPDIGRITDLAGIDGVPNDPFNITGTLRRSGSIVSGKDISITIEKTIFSLDGQFDDFPNPQSATASLRIEGPDVGRFNRLLGLPGRLDGPFEIDMDISPNDNDGANISLKADAGDISFKLDGDFTDDPDFVGSKAQIRLQAANFGRIADAFEIENMPQRPIDLSAELKRVDKGVSIKDGRLVFGKDQVSFSGMVGDEPLKPGTEIRFQSKIPDLQASLADFGIEIQNLPVGDFIAAGQLAGGDERISLRDIKLSMAGVKADLEAQLALDAILANSEIDFRIEGDNLSSLVPANDVFRTPEKKFSLRGSVRLEPKLATISKLKFRVGKNNLTADIVLGMDPILGSVSATMAASGPDLYGLAANTNDIPVPGKAPFELKSEIAWEDGLLSIRDFKAKIGEGRLEVEGTIQNPPNFDNSDLRLVMHIADMRNLSVFAGRELPSESADLDLRLRGDGNTITLEEFDGRFGDSYLKGDFFYRAGDIPEYSLKLVSSRLNLKPYLPPLETVQAQAQPKPIVEPIADSKKEKSTRQSPDGRVIPDSPIPFNLLQGYMANFEIRIEELNLRQHTIRDLAVNAKVANGSLEIEQFKARSKEGGKLSGRLGVEPNPNGAEIWMSIVGSDLELGLPAETEEELEALPRFDLNLGFRSAGANPRELAAAASGYLKLTSGEGRIRAGSMQMFTQDFLFELLNKVNPFTKTDPYTNLKCTVVLAIIEQGKISGAPVLVLQSDRLKILADSRIDLNIESLDVNISTTPMKGLGLSLSGLVNPYVKVGGTLGSPVLVLNTEGAILEGGAAVATGGISILALGLKDRFFSSRDPCGKAIADSKEKFAELENKYNDPPSPGE